MAALSLLAGITTDFFSDSCALRMRVSISATGSHILIDHLPELPARLDHARNFTAHRDLPQLAARQTELAEYPARPAGQPAAVAQPDRGRVPRQFLQPEPRLIALFGRQSLVAYRRNQLRALGGEFLNGFASFLVAVD